MKMTINKPCKYFEDGECNGYYKIDCPYQYVDWNYYGGAHKEINVVNCTKGVEDGNDD